MSSSESENEDESNLPPAAECEQRCQRFAEVTGTDTALAMFFLQDRQWNLDRALDAFFSQNPGYGDSSQEYPALKHIVKQEPKSSSEEASKEETSDLQPLRIRILSWNIDGLDLANLRQRTRAVVDTIKAEKAEVVLLQEVVADSEKVLRDGLSDYRVVSGKDNREGYYTVILLHKTHTMLDDFTITPFTSSQMGRNLLTVNSTVKGVAMTLMTTHLESTKTHAAERKRQLQIAFKSVQDSPSDRTVLFGGDLNIRDKEMSEVGDLPSGVLDVWEATGSRKEARYTWDTYRNDNLNHEGMWRTRLRFDRLFLRHTSPDARLKPLYFELVGLQRIPDVHRFPSDHWGILAHFDIVQALPASSEKSKA